MGASNIQHHICQYSQEWKELLFLPKVLTLAIYYLSHKMMVEGEEDPYIQSVNNVNTRHKEEPCRLHEVRHSGHQLKHRAKKRTLVIYSYTLRVTNGKLQGFIQGESPQNSIASPLNICL